MGSSHPGNSVCDVSLGTLTNPTLNNIPLSLEQEGDYDFTTIVVIYLIHVLCLEDRNRIGEMGQVVDRIMPRKLREFVGDDHGLLYLSSFLHTTCR